MGRQARRSVLARAAGFEWLRLIEIDFDACYQGSKTPYKLGINRTEPPGAQSMSRASTSSTSSYRDSMTSQHHFQALALDQVEEFQGRVALHAQTSSPSLLKVTHLPSLAQWAPGKTSSWPFGASSRNGACGVA